MFTGYDHLKPRAAALKVAHPLMLRAIAAAKKKNDRIDASKILFRGDLAVLTCPSVRASVGATDSILGPDSGPKWSHHPCFVPKTCQLTPTPASARSRFGRI